MKTYAKPLLILLVSAQLLHGGPHPSQGLQAGEGNETLPEVRGHFLEAIEHFLVVLSKENALKVQETQPLYKKCLPAGIFSVYTMVLAVISYWYWPEADERRGTSWGPRGVLTKGTAILGFFSAQQMLDNLSTCITEATYSP